MILILWLVEKLKLSAFKERGLKRQGVTGFQKKGLIIMMIFNSDQISELVSGDYLGATSITLFHL